MEAPENRPSPRTEICGRCGKRYPREDRRAQLRGPVLCRACHLDPELRRLAISISQPRSDDHNLGARVKTFSGWAARCISTLGTIVARPTACFRAVEEPVRLAPWIAFLLTIASPSWLGLLGVSLQEQLRLEGPRLTFSDPRWLDLQIGSAGVDALDLWSLAMFPLGLLAIFFCAGTLAHLLVLLTGPSSRTLGASLRAMAISLVPVLLVQGPLEVAFRAELFGAQVWMVAAGITAIWSLALLALGLSRSHHTALIRGWVAAPLPWALVQAFVLMRAAFAMRESPLLLG